MTEPVSGENASGAAGTRILASCEACGPMAVDVGAVTVYRFATASLVGVRCPRCRLESFRLIHDAVLDTLTRLGARVGRLPWELDERHDGPPLTWDEVLDAAAELRAGDAWCQGLLG